MPEVKNSDKLNAILNKISLLDEKIGSDFGWCEVHDYLISCYGLTHDASCSGKREAEIFQDGLEVAWEAMISDEHIYYYEAVETAFYFVGPLDSLLASLNKILTKSKTELENIKTKKKQKHKKTKITNSLICPDCGYEF